MEHASLPAAGAVLRRRPPPLPALASHRLRPRRPPRRRAVLVPPGHGRSRYAAGRRHAVRRLLLASTGVARRRHERPPRPRVATMAEVDSVVADLDPGDARLALRAAGLLREFNVAGVLDAADVHVATRLGAHHGRDRRVGCSSPSPSPFAGRGSLTSASTWPACARTATSELDEPAVVVGDLPWPDPADWIARLAASPLVADGPGAPPRPRPLRLEGTRLYLDRYWRQECSIADGLLAAAAPTAPVVDAAALRSGLDELFGADETDLQRASGVGGRSVVVLRRRRRPRNRQDDDGRPDRGPARPSRRRPRGGRSPASRSPPRPGRPPPDSRRPCTPKRGNVDVAPTGQGATAGSPRVHAPPAARLAARHPQPVPPRPHQPAAVRRRDRRRDVDGVDVDDGQPRRRRRC